MFLTRLPRLIMVLVILAFAMRALVPAGYMPDQTHGKVFHMVICSLDGPKTIDVDSKFRPVSSDAKHIAKEKCEFSTLTHSPYAKSTVQGFVVVMGIGAIAVKNVLTDLVAAKSERYARAQPRGPPSLS